MTPEDDGLAMSVPGTPEAVGKIRTAVCQFAMTCGLPEGTIEAIKLAVSEAATNAVLHGYSDHAGQITVVSELDASGALRVVIADRGRGMLPHRASEGLGLGVPIMTTMADHVDITSPTNQRGTEVHMHFHTG